MADTEPRPDARRPDPILGDRKIVRMAARGLVRRQFAEDALRDPASVMPGLTTDQIASIKQIDEVEVLALLDRLRVLLPDIKPGSGDDLDHTDLAGW